MLRQTIKSTLLNCMTLIRQILIKATKVNAIPFYDQNKCYL